jgi:AcrR family transcriptional regulator
MKEALAGPRAALDARDEGIAEIAEIVERALARAPSSKAVPDLPFAMAIGGIYRLLASCLRRGERALDGIREDLLGWLESYERPAGEQRWRTLTRGPAIARSPFLSATPFQASPRLPPGRSRLDTATVAENHRQRIMLATCEIVQEEGYSATKVAEITRLAGVDGRAFYRLFTGKQEAFSAVYELGFQHLMTTSARAFFSGHSWPERFWETMRAATQTVQADPALAYAGFVAAYAVGPGEIQRVEDSRVAFGIFLQEGYSYDPQRSPPSRLALEAIMATVFEIVYHQARHDADTEIAGLLPHIVRLCLTPFMGTEQADRFVDDKLAESRRASDGKGAAKAKRSSARRARGSRATAK